MIGGSKRRVVLRAMASTNAFALFALSLLIGVKMLELPPAWSAAVAQLWFVAVVIQVASWVNTAIGLDKPFEPGDFIVVGGIAGSIEHVGLKTTRIRSLGGEQIVCSNTELLKQTIQNYKRMELRRIAFRFVVAYGARAEQAQGTAEPSPQAATGRMSEMPPAAHS